MRILIVGAGGQGSVVAGVLIHMRDAGSDVQAAGFLDDDPANAGEEILGLPILGPLSERARHPHDALVISIGEIAAKKKIFEQLRSEGEKFFNAIHPRTTFYPGTAIGAGCTILPGTIINSNAIIGDNVMVISNTVIGHHDEISDHAFIGALTTISGDVRIGEGAWIANGVSIIENCQIGAGSIVGAGAAVTEDIPENVLAMGVPARAVKSL